MVREAGMGGAGDGLLVVLITGDNRQVYIFKPFSHTKVSYNFVQTGLSFD